MKWLRFRTGGRECFGILAGDKVQVYEGEKNKKKQERKSQSSLLNISSKPY